MAIVVVDDDDDVRNAVRAILEDEGHRTIGAGTGEEALFLLEHSEHRPSLILLDLMMPGMDGWQFLARIDEQADLHSIPVALMSAHPSVRKAFERSKHRTIRGGCSCRSHSTFCGFCRSSNRSAVGPIHRSEFLQESARRDDGRTTL